MNYTDATVLRSKSGQRPSIIRSPTAAACYPLRAIANDATDTIIQIIATIWIKKKVKRMAIVLFVSGSSIWTELCAMRHRMTASASMSI